MSEYSDSENKVTEDTAAQPDTETASPVQEQPEQSAGAQQVLPAETAEPKTENRAVYGQTGRQTYGQTYRQAGQTGQQPYGQGQQPYGQPGQTGDHPYGQVGRQAYGQSYQRQQQTGGYQQQTHYNYYQRQQAQQQTQHAAGKQKSGTGSRWSAVVAMALVFGLIAGTAAFGINRTASFLFPAQTEAEASASVEPEAVQGRVQLATVNTGDSAESYTTSMGIGSVAQVAADAMPSLVTISTMSVQEMISFFGTQQYEAQGAGTGVIVGENDTELLIATNNHVVEGAQEVSIGFIDETVVEAQIKGTDSSTDLAIVAVNKEDIPDETMDQIKIAVIGNSDDLVLGEQVVAIGNALGYGQSVTTGVVSAFNRELDLSDGFSRFTSSGLIQTDAAINSGNSGGALLNMKGELIGINEAKSSFSSSGVTVDSIGYAIPMAKAQPILEELMNQATREKYSEEEQGYLGVSLVNISSEFAQLYGTPQGVGFAEVAEDSPAAKAGAMKGDILTEFNGKNINSVDEMLNEIQYYKSGEEVEMTVLRADNGEYKEMTLTVTLGTQDAISTLQMQ